MSYKRRKRIKWNNLFKLLMIILIITFSFNGIKYYTFNKKIYNNIKKNSLIIKSNKKNIKLSNKNLEYIIESNVKVTIINKKNEYVLNNSYLNKKTNIKLDISKKRIHKKEFNNSKALFIDTKKINIGDIKIKLPRFLNKHKVVDIYGVNNDSYTKLYSKNVKNKKILFNNNGKYEKLVIVFVKPKDIKINSNQKKKNKSTFVLDYTLYPKYSTIERINYENVDNKYISIKDNKITTKKEGKTEFNFVIGKIKKKINLTIVSNKYPVTKKNGINYVDGIMIVNKTYSISKKYDPKDLLDETKQAFRKMQNEASADGINLWIVSGYRSYNDQVIIYNNYVKISSTEEADTYSARPGYSEHQTGYVVDLNDATSNFENTKEAKWIEENCYKYGFIVRYPKGKEKYTGYKYEPWHLRYVGIKKAKIITESGLSLEEYYGLSSKYKN